MPFITGTFSGPGTLTVDPDATVSTALTTIATQLTALNGFLTANWSPTAAGTALTPNALLYVTANALDGIMQNIDSMNQLNATSTGSMGNIQKSIAGIQTALNDLTANIQLAASNQIDKAEFDKAATNAALKRNGLPEVEVPEATVSSSISKSANRAVTMATAVQTTSLVSTAIQRGTTYVSQQVDQYAITPVTSWISDSFKSIFKTSNPDSGQSKTTTEIKGNSNRTKLVAPTP